MKESLFTYPVTRPYPYRWFTPVVVVATIIALILFSVLNYASSGYTLAIQYTSDPNATASEAWFKNWPSLMTSKVRPTCQATVIPLNTQLLTNNTALTYTLTEVKSDMSGYLPSLIYFNNKLQDCTVDGVRVDIQQYGRTAAQISMAAYGVDVNANVVCRIETESFGNLKINLTANYNILPASASIWNGQYRFLGLNGTSNTSLSWGQSTLSMLWASLSQTMFHSTFTLGSEYGGNLTEWAGLEWQGSSWSGDWNGITEISMFFTRSNNSQSGVLDRAYYDLDWRLTAGWKNGWHGTLGRWLAPNILGNITYLIEKAAYPNTWEPADSLAKVFESTVLADLGQTSAEPNILTDQQLSQNFTSGFPAIMSDLPGALALGPSTAPYNPANATGVLQIDPSVLATNYLCQVPRRKELGSLLVSVLTSDLVFVQALWLAFTLIVGYVLKSNHAVANHCEGCRGTALTTTVADDKHHSRGHFSKLSQGTDEDFVEEQELSTISGRASPTWRTDSH